MRFTNSISAVLALGTLAIPAMSLPATDANDDTVFLNDELAVARSNNASIDDVERSGVGQAHPHGTHPAGCDPIQHLAANGGTHTENYTPVQDNGISLKVRRDDGNFQNHILQFEYTNRGPDLHPRISYDISEVDSDTGDFWRKQGAGGFTLTTSDNDCFHKHCAPPCKTCKGVFTQPENGTPHYCGYGKDIGMTVCG